MSQKDRPCRCEEHVSCVSCNILAFGEHGRTLDGRVLCDYCTGRRVIEARMSPTGRVILRRFRLSFRSTMPWWVWREVAEAIAGLPVSRNRPTIEADGG